MADLLLIRHAKSDWRLESLADHERPLNHRGLRDCLRYVPRLPGLLPAPQLLLVSPAARTVQTAQALAEAFSLPPAAVRLRPPLYEATVKAIAAEVAAAPRATSVVGVVGHNPGLNDLYTWCTGQPLENLPTLGVAHLRVPARWTLTRGGCHVVALYTPRSLRDPT